MGGTGQAQQEVQRYTRKLLKGEIEQALIQREARFLVQPDVERAAKLHTRETPQRKVRAAWWSRVLRKIVRAQPKAKDEYRQYN